MAKEVLVTGGSGFLGRNLVEKLSGYHIQAPSHKELDLNSLDQVDEYFQAHSPEVVVHCATRGDRAEFDVAQNDLRMFFNLVEQDVPLIHLGSGAEYGKHQPLVNVAEVQFGMVVPHDLYGFSKFVMSRYVEAAGREIVCLRPFGVFGKYEDPNRRFISNAIGRALKGEPIVVYQDLTFDYLYVDDFVRIVDHFIQVGPPWRQVAYNLGGHRVSLVELAKRINRITGNREIRVLNKREKGLPYTANNDLLMEEIDFKLTDLDYALEQMVAWYRTRT